MSEEAALQARVDALSGRAERSAAAIGRLRDEVMRQEDRAQQTAAALAQVARELDAARTEAASARDALSREPVLADDQRVDSLTAELVAIEKSNLDGQVGLAHQEEILSGAQALLDEEAGALAELTRQLGPEAEQEPAEGELDWEQTQRLIVRLERQLAGLGPVNELAIEEFRRDGGRLDQIAGQLEDLSRARTDLEQIAAQLGAEIEHRFEAVFGAVAFNFQETFGTLFVGGKATLQLDDPEAEEPGVEILAQPAGKRMRSIRLLSGGERALTALAFILALEKVNPSPFYIFDEVDAPLDDANVKRFNTMLQSMAQENQFILITHNHITMTSAQALYGVTLEDSGVSRVVSVRLQGKELVEAATATG
jgi:chromosome segregation protein